MKNFDEIIKKASLSGVALEALKDYEIKKKSGNQKTAKIQPQIPSDLVAYLKKSAKIEGVSISKKLEKIIVCDMEKTAKGFEKVKRDINKQLRTAK